MNWFINEIVNEMQPIANDSKITINFEAGKNNLSIDADPTQLRRVIKNLISNAIDHSNTKKAD